MSVLKPTELFQVQVAGWDLAVNETVRVFLLWTVQLLTVLVHVLQHPTAVGRRQLEPHLFGVKGDLFFSFPLQKVLHAEKMD